MSNAPSTAEALLERRRDRENGGVENVPSVLRASNMASERRKIWSVPPNGSSGHARVERSDPSVLTRTHYVLLIKDRNTKNSVVGDKTGGF